VSEAMSEVVAVAFDGYDAMLPDSARLLYFSKRRNNGGGGFLSEEVWQLAGRSMSCALIVFTEGLAGRERQ
jgi:hypothetical protein